MLKIIISLERLILEQLEIYNNKIDKFDISSSEKITKKSKKSKNQNLSKF